MSELIVGGYFPYNSWWESALVEVGVSFSRHGVWVARDGLLMPIKFLVGGSRTWWEDDS